MAISSRIASAACRIGSASAAPLPSPRRRPRSSSGSSPSASSTSACPGSGERCAATIEALAPGVIRSAASAAVPVMKPSSRMTSRRSAAPERDAREERDLESAQRGEHVDRVAPPAPLTASARRTAATLRASPASSSPVPGPHTASGSAPSRPRRARTPRSCSRCPSRRARRCRRPSSASSPAQSPLRRGTAPPVRASSPALRSGRRCPRRPGGRGRRHGGRDPRSKT